MPHIDIEQFFRDNPLIGRWASAADLEQLRRISKQYPDRVRLLPDADAVELTRFMCQRCGTCCSAVKFISVCHCDVLRWIAQGRWDILAQLAVDRRRTPLVAIWGREAIAAAREKARALLERCEIPDDLRPCATEILYVTDLVESAVYARREDGHCTFFSEEGATCLIHDTKPRACEKFPFYVGHFTDPRLLKINFCPALKGLTVGTEATEAAEKANRR